MLEIKYVIVERILNNIVPSPRILQFMRMDHLLHHLVELDRYQVRPNNV